MMYPPVASDSVNEKVRAVPDVNLPGLNVCGYFRDESGWGAAGRSYVRALRALGAPIALRDISGMSTNRSQDHTLAGFGPNQPYPLNLICVDPTQHFAALSEVGAAYFQGHYNIGAWAWELPRFPAKWLDRLAFYDEIWVMSSFVADALAPLSPVPVVRIPPVLALSEKGSREAGRRLLGLQPDEFVFLFVFDFHSHLARKNPLALIDAFKLAFAPTDRVRLVIKCVNGESDPEGFAALATRAAGYPVLVYDGYWTANQVRDLYAASDAYVSLHRSEGLGLTIAEAMAHGKPVIATGWSGNMDLMTVSNSYPVRHRLVEIESSVGPYRAGEVWAEPSVEHAAELLRYISSHLTEAQERGETAQQEIETNFSEDRIAALIRQRLEAIAIRRNWGDLQGKAWAAFFDYQRLASRLREVVGKCIPPGATVLVVSKGDDELLQLDGRMGRHFPQTENGLYLGYHPADSYAAIQQLENLRAEGSRYMLIPNVSFWWLEYYKDFREYLDECYRRIWSDDSCIIYDLDRTGK
jgi:glycosyltransferase involved in cell wall biosynthesis